MTEENKSEYEKEKEEAEQSDSIYIVYVAHSKNWNCPKGTILNTFTSKQNMVDWINYLLCFGHICPFEPNVFVCEFHDYFYYNWIDDRELGLRFAQYGKDGQEWDNEEINSQLLWNTQPKLNGVWSVLNKALE